MMFILLFFSFAPLISSKPEAQQIINIHINEELPLSTILFTTTTNSTYRLFDSGRNHNSFIHYNTSNGRIYLSQSLDREDLCSQHICSCYNCQLTIELIEWQIPYRLLKLILILEDINDHHPRFSSPNYQLTLRENVPLGFELPLESATDIDLGENSRITYELKNASQGPFRLITQGNGGLILKVIEEIDREQLDFYQYELIAYDHGRPRLQSSTNLSIRIEDINDNPVVLARTYLHLHVSENTPIGTELTSINATDKDIGLNGKIHYSISNGYPMDHFHIGDANGILTLINALDYELEQSYRLTIQVRDLGENSLARFVTIDLSVLDENDNSPQAFVTFVQTLSNDSIISIMENTPIGQILAHISISDQDSGFNGRLTYRIEEGHEIIGIKVLDERSFLLVIDHSIDREDEDLKVERLVLVISDHGKPSKSLRLEYQIDILDLNDSPPKFHPSFKCHLRINASENRSFDQPLFRVQAFDADLDENALISYSILSPNDQSFMINPEGEIFHFEDFNQSSYHLRIMAIDHGEIIQLNCTTDCFISISTNDDLPKLTQPMNVPVFQYTYFVLFFVLLLIIGTVLSCYKLFFHHRPGKTYHLYVSLPRKSLYINDQSPCDTVSDEFVHLNNDHCSDKDSLTSFPRTVQNHYPSIKSREDSRPVSISISTATTCVTSNSTC